MKNMNIIVILGLSIAAWYAYSQLNKTKTRLVSLPPSGVPGNFEFTA